MTVESHPTRGAWIEIQLLQRLIRVGISRTLPGVRGLKYYFDFHSFTPSMRRTLPGVRGLK